MQLPDIVRATGGLCVGEKYRITHMTPSQRLERESVMPYLGRGGLYVGDLLFSGRPLAGTQALDVRWIRAIERVDKHEPVYVNRVVRP